MIIYSAKTLFVQEMLLITPLLSAFEFVQIMATFGCENFEDFVGICFIRIGYVFVFRVLFDPVIHNVGIYKKRLYKWIKSKSENDDFYEKFLPYFKENSKT